MTYLYLGSGALLNAHSSARHGEIWGTPVSLDPSSPGTVWIEAPRFSLGSGAVGKSVPFSPRLVVGIVQEFHLSGFEFSDISFEAGPSEQARSDMLVVPEYMVTFKENITIPGSLSMGMPSVTGSPNLIVDGFVTLAQCIQAEASIIRISGGLKCSTGVFILDPDWNSDQYEQQRVPSLLEMNPPYGGIATIEAPSILINTSTVIINGSASFVGNYFENSGTLQFSLPNPLTKISVQGNYNQTSFGILNITANVTGLSANATAISIFGDVFLNGTVIFDLLGTVPGNFRLLLLEATGNVSGTFQGDAKKFPGASTTVSTLAVEYSEDLHQVYLVFSASETTSTPWYTIWWLWLLFGAGLVVLIVVVFVAIRASKREKYEPIGSR